MRIAAACAAAVTAVVFGVEVRVEAELALELGNDPLMLGIETGELIEAVQRLTPQRWITSSASSPTSVRNHR